MRYTITLQAVLAPGDQVQQVTLAGSISNDTGERPVVAYLFGVEAIGMANNSNLGVVRFLLVMSCVALTLASSIGCLFDKGFPALSAIPPCQAVCAWRTWPCAKVILSA